MKKFYPSPSEKTEKYWGVELIIFGNNILFSLAGLAMIIEQWIGPTQAPDFIHSNDHQPLRGSTSNESDSYATRTTQHQTRLIRRPNYKLSPKGKSNIKYVSFAPGLQLVSRRQVKFSFGYR